MPVVRGWQVLERGWSDGQPDLRGLLGRDILDHGWILGLLCLRGWQVLAGLGGSGQHDVQKLWGRDVLERGGGAVERIVPGMCSGEILGVAGGVVKSDMRGVRAWQVL